MPCCISVMAFNHTAFLVALTVIDILAMLLLLFRISFRLHIGRFWWEDVWAVVVFVCAATCVVSQFIYYETAGYKRALVTMWILSTSFTSTLWSVRMSLLYSTIRVISPLSALRKFTRVVAVLFFSFWTIMIGLKTWWCATNMIETTAGSGVLIPSCSLRDPIVTFKLITDCISDATLVILSLRLFWRVKLPRRQRRMILSIFSSGTIMSMASLFHAISEFGPRPDLGFVAFNLEIASALIVCNMLVLVTYIYRVILSSSDGSLPPETEVSSEDDDFTTRNPARMTTELLTTVDLNTLDTASGTTFSKLTGFISSSFNRGSAAS